MSTALDCVTEELCRARHGEVINAIGHLEKKIDNLSHLILGNGKPGLRHTQLQVEDLRDWKRQCEQNSRSLCENIFRAALPYLFAVGLFLVWLFIDAQGGLIK
jgi:hypothetical protein